MSQAVGKVTKLKIRSRSKEQIQPVKKSNILQGG
jgi:hypothetical protein